MQRKISVSCWCPVCESESTCSVVDNGFSYSYGSINSFHSQKEVETDCCGDVALDMNNNEITTESIQRIVEEEADYYDF